MSGRSLAQKLDDAKIKINEMDRVLQTHHSRFTDITRNRTASLLAAHENLPAWKTELEHRESAMSLLENLSSDDGHIVVLGQRQPFVALRQLLITSYLVTTWSICDSFCATFGRFLCVEDYGRAPGTSAQLVRSFLRKEKDGWCKALPGALADSLSQAFGWPVALSYALRNIFAHEGGRVNGKLLLQGDHLHGSFKVDQGAWDGLLSDLKLEKESHYFNSATWPVDPTADLRDVLKATEREIDSALGVLLSASLALVEGHLSGFID